MTTLFAVKVTEIIDKLVLAALVIDGVNGCFIIVVADATCFIEAGRAGELQNFVKPMRKVVYAKRRVVSSASHAQFQPIVPDTPAVYAPNLGATLRCSGAG